jgi:hypothetical protein
LLQQCHDEGRYFLTRDQLVQEHKAARDVALILPQANMDQLAALIGARFRLDWLSRAFTRCLLDNTPLQAANADALAKVPRDAIRPDEPLRMCPRCGRVYWRGSHHKRMLALLTRWQNLSV